MNIVKVWRGKKIIPTYQLLEEDINPMIEERLDPYPYTLHNKRSREVENIEHEVVMLENDYLKLIVLPNLGGRLYSAYDKVNNREVFYKNEVIKPRMIGTRGGWFSGGIEFNFPISHSPTSMDRVNCLTKTYKDGSAAIEFGNIELISGMNWKIELRLYNDKAYIEENVRLYNPTRNSNRFYFWTNASVDIDSSVKLIYPFDWCINQIDSEYIKWPFYKGRDFSDLREVPYSYETFGKLLNENFFGIYSKDKQYGMVHYADRKMVKGAKFFTWGNDNLGDAWNKALTDDDSKYLEVQSGPFETQMVYKFMKPHQQLKWSEYWYPISGTEGFVHAGKEITVNFETKENGIDVIFYSAAAVKNCIVMLMVKGKTYEKRVDLQCGKLHRELFELGEPIYTKDVSLEVYGLGKHLISFGVRNEFTKEQLEHDLYEDSRVNRGENYKEKDLDFAIFQESIGKCGDARLLYEKYLAQNPECIVTLNRLGGLYLKICLVIEAEECFRKVLFLDNRNSQARFMLASTLKEKGEFKAARRLFLDIASDCEYYSASIIELVKLNIFFKYYKDAQDIIEQNETNSSYLNFLKSITLRKDGLVDSSREILEKTEINEYILAEKFMIGEENEFINYIKGDENIIIQIALEYLELGLYEEVKKLLVLIPKPSIKTNIIKQKISILLGKPLFSKVEDVLDVTLEYVFINERVLVEELKESYVEDSTGKAAYLLGTYYHSKGRKEEALKLYLNAYKKGLKFTVLLRNLGLIYFSYKNDFVQATKYLNEDIEFNNGKNLNSLIILYKIYSQNGDLKGKKSLLSNIRNADNKSLILIQLVETLRDTGEIEEALKILEEEEFENWEGIENSGYCYKDTIMLLALNMYEQGDYLKALDYIEKVDKFPKGLNYGNSMRLPLAKERYHKGRIYSKNRLEEKAIEEFKKGAFELENEELIHTNESKEFAIKCLGELKKR